MCSDIVTTLRGVGPVPDCHIESGGTGADCHIESGGPVPDCHIESGGTGAGLPH